jgi:hypothetical protein
LLDWPTVWCHPSRLPLNSRSMPFTPAPRYQQAPATPDEYLPLLSAIQGDAHLLTPLAANRALVAASRLQLAPPDGWAVAVVEGSSRRLHDAADLAELARLLRAATAAVAPGRPSSKWASAFTRAAAEVAERRAPRATARQHEKERGEGRGAGGSESSREDGGAEDEEEVVEVGLGLGGASEATEQVPEGLLSGGEVAGLLSAMRPFGWLRPGSDWVAALLTLYNR